MLEPSRLPQRAGIGLKPAHYRDLLTAPRGLPIGFVEIHPQNYACAGGPPHRWLTAVSERFALSFHSVGLSLGGAHGLDGEELEQLAQLVDRYQPAAVSDHLAWCTTSDARLPDLLPLPLNGATLAHVSEQVDRVQTRLGRRLLIENPSAMLAFRDTDMDEPDFLNALARKTGCGLLLDLNNVLVSATNLGFAADKWLARLDLSLVEEIHIAGHSVETHAVGKLAIDDHGSPPPDACWALLDMALAQGGARPVLLEWDNDVPAFSALATLAARADAMIMARSGTERESCCHAAA